MQNVVLETMAELTTGLNLFADLTNAKQSQS